MDTIRGKIDEACRVAEDFSKMYYETLDKRRHTLSRLYLDSAVLSWNGNGVNGNENIQKFYIDLPGSDHRCITLDSQPIFDSAVNNQLTYLIQVSGSVRFQGKVPKSFTQNFLVTAMGDKWKIVTDCFRLQEAMN